MGLHAKLVQAALEVGTIPMLGQMTGGAGNYSFHRAADVFNAVRKAFAERGLTIYLAHLGHDVKDMNLSNGRVMRVAEVDYDLVITDSESGEQLHIPIAAAAQDSGDKYLNKAQTIALKNAFKAMFLIAEPGDDPDDHASPAEHEVAAKPAQKAAAPRSAPAKAAATQTAGVASDNAFRVTDVEVKNGGGPASEKQKRLIRARLSKDLGVKDEVDQGAWVLKITDETLENLDWKWMDVLLAEIDAHASAPAPPVAGASAVERATAGQQVLDALVDFASTEGAGNPSTVVMDAFSALGIADGMAMLNGSAEADAGQMSEVRRKISELVANGDTDIPF